MVYMKPFKIEKHNGIIMLNIGDGYLLIAENPTGFRAIIVERDPWFELATSDRDAIANRISECSREYPKFDIEACLNIDDIINKFPCISWIPADTLA